MIDPNESGPDFEQRGLSLARALHDPTGTQGAVMFEGRERDGLFVGYDAIHAYEFTISGKKEKSVKDGEKLAELLRAVGSRPENQLKARTGWFVTIEEPTAEQRTAIESVARSTGERVHAISISTLYQRICNSELYVSARDKAPFGSIDFGPHRTQSTPRVAVSLVGQGGQTSNVGDLAESLLSGTHMLIVGNYGVGKSHALREIYSHLRKQHFRQRKLSPFPVHINLRDCAGLRTPAEILRRHAEEVGFENAPSLVSAWRAGACVLLLDGFDEIVPTRWFGAASDLQAVRREALSAVRRLVLETPTSSGVVVAGRSHYFSGEKEMLSALGFRSSEQFTVPEFDQEQIKDFLTQAGAGWSVPDWVPARPLLLGYLVAMDSDETIEISSSASRAAGWRRFIDAICERESRMFAAVRPETIREILARVATLARSKGDVTGPLDMESLSSAYAAVNGLQPDEEGVQLLLRLPGLATPTTTGTPDVRVFVDRDLADAAYGIDLGAHVLDPYADSHPLSTAVSWPGAAAELGIEVAADALQSVGGTASSVRSAMSFRTKSQRFDAVMADLVGLLLLMDPDDARSGAPILVSGVYFERFALVDHGVMGSLTLADCVIEHLDVSSVDQNSYVPHFERCAIGLFDGASTLSTWLAKHFSECDIDRYSAPAHTTAGIMSLDIDRESRVALTILRKVFGQRGSARKEGALSRGLALEDRPLVPGILDVLVSQGWLLRSSAGNATLYAGSKVRRADAMRALETPGDFRLLP